MLIISYDIRDDKLRAKFSKMLAKHGAIRLQYSVYEVNMPLRLSNVLLLMIEKIFSKQFEGCDSVIVFEASSKHLRKYGNAIHRDADIVYF